MKHKLSFVILAMLFLVGCSASIPKPSGSSSKPTLLYQPQPSQGYQPKYPVTLGVFRASDKRLMEFYASHDDFFQEDNMEGLSKVIYQELSSSGLFSSVKYIPEPAPADLSPENLMRIKDQHGVDLLFFSDITRFQLLREKLNAQMAWEGQLKTNDMQITIDFGMIGQLVYPKRSLVVWGDSVSERKIAYASSGALEPEELGNITRNALRGAMKDMRVLIATTGKNMRRRG